MEHTASLKALCMDTARSLTGSTRRLFMARTVKALGQADSGVWRGNWAGAG
jgi:hypothetical protein